jgi:hypothetical protein
LSARPIGGKATFPEVVRWCGRRCAVGWMRIYGPGAYAAVVALKETGKIIAQKVKILITLLAVMVVLVGGVAYAANSYPVAHAAKCGDPVDEDDSLLVEGSDRWLGDREWVGDADEPGAADGFGYSSCIKEKE